MVKEVRWRYLIIHIHSPLNLKGEDLSDILRKHFRSFLGIYGLSKHPFKIVAYNELSKIGILKCPHNSLTMIRAAIALLSSTRDGPLAAHVVRVSGTLKKARSIANRFAEKLKSYLEELESGMKKPSQATET
ncbi:MAG: Rpp14/Pop5 family protein [Candidatus Nezhaarchaeales archaeon]